MKKNYYVSKKLFNNMYEKVQGICGSLMVLRSFCGQNKDIEEIRNITPIINNITKESDLLYLYFININDKNFENIREIENSLSS